VADTRIIAYLRRACNYFAAGVGTLDPVGVEGHTRLRWLRVDFSVAGMGRTIDVNLIEAVGFVHFYKVSESLGSESNSLLADGMGDAIVFAILRPGNSVAACNFMRQVGKLPYFRSIIDEGRVE
jgi:hypothetical protein